MSLPDPARGADTLRTERLVVRAFSESDAEAYESVCRSVGNEPDSAGWLRWMGDCPARFAAMTQPPLGDRAVCLADSGELIGAVGIVPAAAPWHKVPGFPSTGVEPGAGWDVWTLEFGLFWMVHAQHQGRGYASEAAAAMVRLLRTTSRPARVTAVTTAGNAASAGVMRKLGMRVEKVDGEANGLGWFGVVGVV